MLLFVLCIRCRCVVGCVAVVVVGIVFVRRRFFVVLVGIVVCRVGRGFFFV